MKIFNYRKYKISKNFLIAASAYRKFANSNNHLFNIDSLLDQYNYETYGGIKPDIKINGFTYGKSMLDLTLKSYKEDLALGLFCKYELKNGSGCFIRNFIDACRNDILFGYSK